MGSKSEASSIEKAFAGAASVKGEVVSYGFFSVEDWLDSVIQSFPSPWRVSDDPHPHYGTEITDATGRHILSIWYAHGKPSARQQGDMTDEECAEYICDTHWESAIQFHIAHAIAELRNSTEWEGRFDSDNATPLRLLIVQFGRWSRAVYDDVKCGGPDRRRTPKEVAALKTREEQP